MVSKQPRNNMAVAPEAEEAYNENISDQRNNSKSTVEEIEARSHEQHKEQLAVLGRVIEEVPRDGNCMFESVARQLDGHKHVFNTHGILRQVTCYLGIQSYDRYKDYLTLSEEEYSEQFDILKEDGAWNLDVGDVAITILQEILQVKIVILRSNSPPQMFPDDGSPIDDETIVIVQDASQTHYDASRPFGKEESAYPSIKEQLVNLRRRIKLVPHDTGSFFRSISSQLSGELSDYTALRRRLCAMVVRSPELYQKHFPSVSAEQLADDFQKLRHNLVWNPMFRNIFLSALQELSGLKVVIIRNFAKSLEFPNNQQPITESDIIIVQHMNRDHYDSTTFIHKELFRESIQRQLIKYRRTLGPWPQDDYSFLRSIVCQLRPQTMSYQQLRAHIFKTVRRSSKYLPLSPTFNHRQILLLLETATDDEIYEYDLQELILTVVHEEFNVKVVVLKDWADKEQFPQDDSEINKDCVVIVEDTHKISYAPTHPNSNNDAEKIDETISESSSTGSLESTEDTPEQNVAASSSPIFPTMKPLKKALKKVVSGITVQKKQADLIQDADKRDTTYTRPPELPKRNSEPVGSSSIPSEHIYATVPEQTVSFSSRIQNYFEKRKIRKRRGRNDRSHTEYDLSYELPIEQTSHQPDSRNESAIGNGLPSAPPVESSPLSVPRNEVAPAAPGDQPPVPPKRGIGSSSPRNNARHTRNMQILKKHPH